MSPSRLTWQKNLGFILPILMGWISVIWLVGLTFWFMGTEFSHSRGWTQYVVLLMWLIHIPFSGYLMGIVSAYCWRNQKWDERQRDGEKYNFLMWFWIFSFPLTLLLLFTTIGVVVFLIHGKGYVKGHERGGKLVRNDEINQLLGRESRWEQHASNHENTP